MATHSNDVGGLLLSALLEVDPINLEDAIVLVQPAVQVSLAVRHEA